MSEFIFLYPLWFLALLPLALLLFWLLRRNQSHSLIAVHLAQGLGLQRIKKSPTFIILLALAWLVCVIALAGPSWQKQMRPSVQNSHGRVLVLDMSQSMYASDVKPNRLTQARYKSLDLLSRWQEGSTGLVTYAADAYIVSPMTSDSNTIANLLPNLSPDIMPAPGADAARGVEQAITMMKNAGLQQGDIVLLADDIDDHERQQISSLLSDSQWHLIILAIGTPDGAPVTLADGRLLQSANGQMVIAKTNIANMRALAKKVNGDFISLQPDNRDVERITSLTQSSLNQLSNKNKQSVEERVNNGFWLVWLLLIPAALLFRRGMIFTLAFCSLLTLPVHHAEASIWLNQGQQAKHAFDQQKYSQAAELFQDPAWQGVAQYQAGQYAEAIDSLGKINNPTIEQQYNLANAYAQHGDYQKALDQYDQLLKKHPDYSDAKYNRKIVADALQQNQQKQPSQSENQQQSDQDKKEPKQKSPQQQSGEDKQDSQPQSSQQQSGGDKQDSQPQSPQQQSGEGQQDSQQQSSQQQSGGDKRDSQQQSSQQQSGGDKQDSQQQSSQKQSGEDTQDSQQQSSQQRAEQNKQDSQSLSDDQQKSAKSQEGEKMASQPLNQKTELQSVDPALRRLEQVESVRDPAELLRAQLYLQSRQKNRTTDKDKTW